MKGGLEAVSRGRQSYFLLLYGPPTVFAFLPLPLGLLSDSGSVSWLLPSLLRLQQNQVITTEMSVSVVLSFLLASNEVTINAGQPSSFGALCAELDAV